MLSPRAALAVRWLWGMSGAVLFVELARGGFPASAGFFAALLGAAALFADGRPWETRPAALCFWASLALYLSTFRWHGGDDITNSLVPLAALKHGTFALTPVIDPFLTNKAEGFTVAARGRLLSFHPIATGIAAIPFYVIPVLCRAPFSEVFLHQMSKLSAAAITAVSAAVFYKACAARAPRRWALALSLAYGAGSFAFSVSSQALWQHGLEQLGLALALWGLAESGSSCDWLAGFGAALAVAARPDGVFFAAALAAELLFTQPRRLPRFLGAAAAVAALMISSWVYYTGRPLPPASMRQQALFVDLSARALAGLLVSPVRGLLPYCPAAFFGFAAVLGPRRERRPLAWALLAASLAQWAFFSCYGEWTAGESFGARYLALVPVAGLFLCADLWEAFERRPAALAWLCGAIGLSVWVNALGGYFTWPGSFAYVKSQVWRWDLHPIPQLLYASGPLGRLPLPARGLAFLGFCVVVGALSRRLYRGLSPSAEEAAGLTFTARKARRPSPNALP